MRLDWSQGFLREPVGRDQIRRGCLPHRWNGRSCQHGTGTVVRGAKPIIGCTGCGTAEEAKASSAFLFWGGSNLARGSCAVFSGSLLCECRRHIKLDFSVESRSVCYCRMGATQIVIAGAGGQPKCRYTSKLEG